MEKVHQREVPLNMKSILVGCLVAIAVVLGTYLFVPPPTEVRSTGRDCATSKQVNDLIDQNQRSYQELLGALTVLQISSNTGLIGLQDKIDAMQVAVLRNLRTPD